MTIQTEKIQQYEMFSKNIDDFYLFLKSPEFIPFLINSDFSESFKWNQIAEEGGKLLLNIKQQPIEYERIVQFNLLVGDFFDQVLLKPFEAITKNILDKYSLS